MANTSILFYSNRCAFSKELIGELYKTGLIESFQKICVDNATNIPKGITSVPTMIVPRYPRPLVGQECFAWLDGIQRQLASRQQSQQVMPGSTGAPVGLSGGVQTVNRDSGETNAMAGSNGVPGFEDLLPFSDTMSGFSDAYSFISDDRPQEHTFAFFQTNGMASNQMPSGSGGIQTPQEINNSDKQNELNSRLERMKADRDRDFAMSMGPGRT